MECPWVARARTRPCVAEDEDQITLAKGDRVRVERHCPESQTACRGRREIIIATAAAPF